MLIPKKKESYDVWHYGITGKIGEGANAEIFYLQSSLKMKSLDYIKLLVDIPGSEKWGVKDLFQRNVDRDRITGPDGLKNYFTDANLVKYFNPIALVLLPTNQNIIQKSLPRLLLNENTEFDNIQGYSYTNTEHYRLFVQKDNDGNVGKIEWNSEKCHVVAIDGQHRLTALKELYSARNIDNKTKDIESWQIPVVFLIVNKKVPEGKSDDLIKIMRKIFMYINMKAEVVNPARAILLNDESIECLCVQEIISAFHENEFAKNNNGQYPPLYLLDWLGKNKDTSLLKDARYLFSNIELRNWIREYLIGVDFNAYERKSDKMQMQRLELQDLDLDFFNDSTILSQSDAKKIRKKFNDLIRDPFLKFLTNLTPIKKYISDCRKYEKQNSEDSAQLKAFSQLRYGDTYKDKSNKEEIENFESAFLEKFMAFKKNNLSGFFRQDISLRGIVFAYGEIYDIYKGLINRELDWADYTDLFLPAFNNLIDSGWCEDYESLELFKKKMLTHICHSDAGIRSNYKIQDVKNAWGIFVIMSVLDYIDKNKSFKDANICKLQAWENYRDRFENTLQKGFRDVAKREADQREMTQIQRSHYIKQEKEKMANERLEEFEKLWNLKANEESSK